MQSRYYNLEWGRFINTDACGGAIGELLTQNIFAYCNNNPVNHADPTGLFGEDLHLGFTEDWARSVGFDKTQAHIIAKGDQYIDDHYPAYLVQNQSWHYNLNMGTSGIDTRYDHFLTCFRLAVEAYKAGYLEIALTYLGNGLHALQDIIAHSDDVVYKHNYVFFSYFGHSEGKDNPDNIKTAAGKKKKAIAEKQTKDELGNFRQLVGLK